MKTRIGGAVGARRGRPAAIDRALWASTRSTRVSPILRIAGLFGLGVRLTPFVRALQRLRDLSGELGGLFDRKQPASSLLPAFYDFLRLGPPVEPSLVGILP